MDVPEHLAGQRAHGVLPDLFENRVAQIVGQHSAEARCAIGKNQTDHHGGGRMSAHPVDGELERIGHGNRHRLAGEHQQHGGNHTRFQFRFALRPEHRQEAPKRPEIPGRFGA